MRNTPKHALFHTGAASEAKVMQPGAYKRVAATSLYTLIKGCLYSISRSSAERGYSCWVPTDKASRSCTLPKLTLSAVKIAFLTVGK